MTAFSLDPIRLPATGEAVPRVAVEFDEDSYSTRVCRCGGSMRLTVAASAIPARWSCSVCGRHQRR